MPAGRPRKQLNENQIFELASIHCTDNEMAAVLDCDVDTLRDNYSAIIQKGRETGKMSLRRAQFKIALSNDKNALGMLIWLGKQLLEQHEKSTISLENVTDKVFEQEARRRLETIKQLEADA